MKRPNLKRIFSKKFTFMLVPHEAGKPLQIIIPLSFIALFFVVWTGVTFWGAYLSAQHIDYWRAGFNNKMLHLKVNYLAKQLEKSRGTIDEVKQIEAKLRDLLDYKSKFFLISNEAPPTEATGGPTLADQNEISNLLNNQGPNLSWERLVAKVGLFNNEINSRIESFDDLSDWIDNQRDIFRATPRGWPCPGHMTSRFGKRTHPFTGLPEFHYGIDIGGPEGTPIRATADGVVKITSWHSGYGKLIVIEHKYGYRTRFAHNTRHLVRIGDKVKRGQVIALVGDSGISTGPHCHYEVWRYNKRVNPYAYMIGDYPKINAGTALTSAKKHSKKRS